MNARPDHKTIQAIARAELDRRKKLLDMKEDAERDLLSFIKMTWHILEPQTELKTGWLLDLMCDTLMAATDGHITRLIENVPPGSMKSLLLNVFWPAWEWGPCNMPWLRYISVSYATSLPERDNARFQRLINHPLYQKCWGDRVKVLKDSVEMVENTATGWKRVLSIGGTTTGWRANRVLIDDANNPVNVESDDVRMGTNLWLEEVMPDRLNDLTKDVIANIQQRTHMADATDTLAKMWADESYVWVCVPMEFDPLRIGSAILRTDEDGSPIEEWTDPRSLDEAGNQLEGLFTDEKGNLKVRMGSPMAKAEGTLCWPERFPPEVIPGLKKSKGPYAWAGQYMQSPTVRGGGMIRRDWWQLWQGRNYPDMGTTVAALDTAMEEKQTNDYNALTVWGAFPGTEGQPQIMLTAAWRDRLPLAQLVARVAEICYERKVDYLLIEHKTRGRDVYDEIVRLYQNAPWQTILVPIKSDKTTRLNAVSHLFSGDVRKDPVTGVDSWSGGMIFAPDTQWAEDVINEISAFPRAPHDDFCFVAGTLITTRRGNVPIETVTTLDECLTPMGWKRVVAAGFTGMRPVMSRSSLTGTANHPIFTLDKGFMPLDTICMKSALGTLSLCSLIRTIRRKPWALMGSPSAAWEGPENTTSLNPKLMPDAKILRDCTLQSGNIIPGNKCQRVMRSTIKMAKLLISAMTIWSAYRRLCIAHFLKNMAQRTGSIWKTFVRWLQNGTGLKLAAYGIESMPKNLWQKDLFQPPVSVKCAALGLRRELTPEVDFAVPPVAREVPIGSKKDFKEAGLQNVSNVGTSFIQKYSSEPNIAQIDVATELESEPDKLKSVYNLTVDDVHCYYANGILVHNCDTASMALGWMRKNGVVLRKVEHDDRETESKKFRRKQAVPYAI